MKLRLPHTYAILFGLVLVASIATHLIPSGEYHRSEQDGREIVDPASYHLVEASPAGLSDVFLAYPRGLIATSSIVFYIFIIGGAFGVIEATGSIDAAITAVVKSCHGRGELVIPALMLLFAIGGGTIGMAEETLPFLPGLVLLARRLGYDEITGGAIALVGAGAGFAGAFLNPFTVGVAQGIAGLPLFSGLVYRLVVWAVFTAVAIAYVSWYCRGIRSPVVELAKSDDTPISLRRPQLLVLLVLGLAVAAIVGGALRWQWGILELSGLFVAVTIAAGWLGGLGADQTADAFVKGASGIAGGALVVGLARGVLVIFEGAHVLDSILQAMAGAVENLPGWASVAGIYGIQISLNFLVPSGSGQAALSIPILAPLGDLVGVTRQTTVLAYQLGDGISNVFTPTQGYFMAGLALIGVSWTQWVRFIWRLQLLWVGIGLVFLLVAHASGWGPF